jgi:hypothetical protein
MAGFALVSMVFELVFSTIPSFIEQLKQGFLAALFTLWTLPVWEIETLAPWAWSVAASAESMSADLRL